MTVSEELRRQVTEEANHRCEYCQTSSRLTVVALRLNNDNIVTARLIWIEFAWHPPRDL
jgi:molybdenum cofactor biosynthesis enzyme MoaA